MAVGSDTGLQRLLEGDDPPALRAQRFLAGLSVVALEQPNVRRGVVVLEPDDWNASSALLESALAGLPSDHPLLEPLTVDDLIGTVPPATSGNAPVERDLAPSPVPPTPVTEREYLDAQTQLDGLQRARAAAEPRRRTRQPITPRVAVVRVVGAGRPRPTPAPSWRRSTPTSTSS